MAEVHEYFDWADHLVNIVDDDEKLKDLIRAKLPASHADRLEEALKALRLALHKEKDGNAGIMMVFYDEGPDRPSWAPPYPEPRPITASWSQTGGKV